MKMQNGKFATDNPPTTGSLQLGEIRTRWDRAVADYTAARAELLHEDGVPRYGARENKARVDAAINQLKAAAKAARNAAIALRDAADNQRQAAHIDPLLQLTTPAERAEVAYKMPVIREAVETSALGDLVNQLKAMALHGTRVEQLLFLRYSKPHLQAMLEAAITGNKIVPDLREARDALTELENVSMGDTLTRQKTAVDAAAEAGRLIMSINLAESNLLSEAAPVVDVQRRF